MHGRAHALASLHDHQHTSTTWRTTPNQQTAGSTTWRSRPQSSRRGSTSICAVQYARSQLILQRWGSG
eukprot:4721586-Pyramimonas_sp.AAC.1